MKEELKYKVEAYLGGRFSSEENAAFELQLQNDASLREELLVSKEIIHFLRSDTLSESIPENDFTEKLRKYLMSDEAAAMKKKLKEVSSKYHSSKSTNKGFGRWFAIASMLVVFIGTLSYFYLVQDDYQDLYASYYSNDDLPSVVKRGDENSNLIEGALAYQKGDYSEASALFQDYLVSISQPDPAAYIYDGATHLQLGEFEEALISFDSVIKSNSLDQSKALWFKALTYLKMEDITNAKSTLTVLKSNSQNFKYSEAIELLAELN